MKFKQGKIYKSKLRTSLAPLYVMVIEEKDQLEDQFKGVVLLDFSKNGEKKGLVSDSWNKPNFSKSSMKAVLISYIKNKL